MIDHRGVIGEPAVVTEAALLAREQALEGRGPMAAVGRALRLEIVDADLGAVKTSLTVRIRVRC